ncbi:MAG: phasin family protein [Pseudomonadota bacterium]|nr:phasin family protein [Pseudomonadota bacterium]
MADETTPGSAAAPKTVRKRATPRRAPAKAAADTPKPEEVKTAPVAKPAPKAAAPKAAAAPKPAAPAKAAPKRAQDSVLDSTAREVGAAVQARFGDFFAMMLDSIELAKATNKAAFEASKGLAAMQTDFVRARLDAQAKLSAKVSRTQDIQAIMAAQREYAENAVAAWSDHSTAVNERCQKILSEGVDPISKTWKEAAVHLRDVGF